MILSQIRSPGTVKNAGVSVDTVRIFYGEGREGDQNHRL